MSEREGSAAPKDAWDLAAVAKHLGATAEPTDDIAFGSGVSLQIGVPPFVHHLDLFPTAAFIRLRSLDLQLDLYRVGPPTLTDEGVVFTRERPEGLSMLSVSKAGEVTAYLAAQPNGEPTANRAEPDLLDRQSEGEEAAAKGTGAAPRVTLFGRVAATPRFRTTPNAVLVGQFPLAVHEEEEKTTWHTIVAFGPRAEKLREAVKADAVVKGQNVQVIGYRHTRDVPTRSGGSKRVEEIYAVAVRSR